MRAGIPYSYPSHVPTHFENAEKMLKALTKAKAHVINFAKKHYPDLIDGWPANFEDPIDCNLFAKPKSHYCKGVEHRFNNSNYLKPNAMSVGLYRAMQIKVPGPFCPYTKDEVNPKTDYLLQDEIYLFVLRRIRVLPLTASSSMHCSSYTLTMSSSRFAASSSTALSQSGSNMSTSYPANPIKALKQIGALLSSIVYRIDRTYPITSRPCHDLNNDEYCRPCFEGLKKVPPSKNMVEKYRQITQLIAQLPSELQNTLCYKIWQKRTHKTAVCEPNWGKKHLLNNLHKTVSAVREILIENDPIRSSQLRDLRG